MYWGGGDTTRTPYQQYMIYIIEAVFGVMLGASLLALFTVIAVYAF
jgi:hypothetical protein